jgi:branched-chain amino acid transport system permease protein
MYYILHIIIFIFLYWALAASLNLVVGYTGILSIGHAAFYGVGAYTVALMSLHFHTPFLVNVFCAVFTCVVLAVLVGAPTLRLRNDDFVIASFAFQVIVFNVLNNWLAVTGGPMGLPGIPKPVIFGWQVSSHWGFLALTGLLCIGISWICSRIISSPFGRMLKTVREDDVFAQAAGKNVAACKVLIFAIGAAMAGAAGVLYAHYISFIDPTSFTVMESIFIISIVIVGGAGSLWGPVVGAVVLVTLPEILRFVGMPSSIAANVRQILYGGLLVVFMMLRPQGLMGHYAFGKGGKDK